jgi:[NiFe] hydrogenase diaphorase moiety small subunit
VGAILHKHHGYETPIGQRLYDVKPISVVSDAEAREVAKKKLKSGGPK